MSGMYAVVIPAYVDDSPDLSINEKYLCGTIAGLCNRRGFCWASNAYFSKKMGVTIRSVQKWLVHLQQKEFVYIDKVAGHKRRIYVDKRCLNTDGKVYEAAMKEDMERQIKESGDYEYPSSDVPGSDINGKNTTVSEASEPEFAKTPPKSEPEFTHTSLPIENKRRIIKKGTSVPCRADARASPDVAKEVGKKVLKAMTDQFPITRDQYPREAKNARTIANRVCEMSPDAPQEAATVVLRAFADLVEHGDGFWRKQPYTASTLVSAGIWSRVIKHIRDAQQEYDTRASPEVQEWRQFAEEVWG